MKPRRLLPRCFCSALPSIRVFRSCRATKIPARERGCFCVRSKAASERELRRSKKLCEVTKARRGEIIASGGAAAANQLGLTTQLPVRQVYLTSGPFRESILQHTMANRRAGAIVRALDRVGPKTARQALRSRSQRPSLIEVRELKSAGSSLPTWLAKPVSEGARYLCDPERREARGVTAANSGWPAHRLEKDVWVV